MSWENFGAEIDADGARYCREQARAEEDVFRPSRVELAEMDAWARRAATRRG